jgi:flagellar basal body-associated protein FliL
MDEKKVPENVPYIVHEGDMARLERSNKRLLIALIAALIVMLLNNIAWLTYNHFNQSDTTQEITSEVQP